MQVTASPPLQAPEWQASPVVHASASSQALPFGSGAVQLSAPSLQDSAQLPSPSALPVQGSPACTAQEPAPSQWSAPLQNWLSLQETLEALKLSAGHSVDDPVQFSAMSQKPFALRQVTRLDATRSAGQSSTSPVQTSVTSQTLTAPRQRCPARPSHRSGKCW